MPYLTSQTATNSYYYQAFGLTIDSKLPFPELVASNKIDADAVIRFNKLDYSPLTTNSVQYSFQLTSEGMYLFWQGVGMFLIRDGKEIIIDAEPEADIDKMRLFILGAAMGVLLHQRGCLTLHASAVAVNGNAVAFLGNKGWGKSTLAATFHACGHSLLTDDVAAIDVCNSNEPSILPAFPQLKLWPDAVTSLGRNPENLPQLIQDFEKRNCLVSDGFMQKPVPLKQIYVLSTGDTLEIQTVKPQEILTYLISNSYITRFGDELLQLDRASHFVKLTLLAKQTSIYRLIRPKDISLLPQTVQLVEKHLNCQFQPTSVG